MKPEEMKKAELVEYVGQLEGALSAFGGFKPSVEMAEMRRAATVDIGVSTERLRTVVELCEEIKAREEPVEEA